MDEEIKETLEKMKHKIEQPLIEGIVKTIDDETVHIDLANPVAQYRGLERIVPGIKYRYLTDLTTHYKKKPEQLSFQQYIETIVQAGPAKREFDAVADKAKFWEAVRILTNLIGG